MVSQLKVYGSNWSVIALVFYSLCFGQVAIAVEPFYSLTYESIEKKPVSLKSYQGKVVMIVNTASKCGFTKQYAALEDVYKEYKDQGLVVIGFPSNDFGSQEPGSNQEIATFCKKNYGVSFPMAAKIQVKGEQKHPLYSFLTSQAKPKGEVRWNFEKFLIDQKGRVVERFASKVKPDSDQVLAAIKKLIPKKPL